MENLMNAAEPVWLVTGFEPFDGESVNPSWEVAQALHGAPMAGGRVLARQLPCRFGAARDAMVDLLAEWRPLCVLALGQAGGRTDFSLERIAINLDDARIADNAGAQPIDQPVVPGGPAAYFATLPIKAVVSGLRAAGLPASVSHSAGTFVCNHVFYALMHGLREQPQVRAGFMHLPLLPAQASRHPGQACMPLPLMIEGVRQALRIAASHQGADLDWSAGQIA
jgi:pyroglutamyl-peptidase